MRGKFSWVKVTGVVLLAVVLASVLACTGPAGPAGAPGAAGPPGEPGAQFPPACIEVIPSAPFAGTPIGAIPGVGTDLGMGPATPILPPGIPANWMVTIMGTGFTPGTSVEVVMVGVCPPGDAYNERRAENGEDYILRMAGVMTDGSFKIEPGIGMGGAWGMLPEGLTPGVYTIKATDSEGIVATTPLLVLPPAAMTPPTERTIIVAPAAPGLPGGAEGAAPHGAVSIAMSGHQIGVFGAGFNPGTHPMNFVGDPPGPPLGAPAINPIKIELLGVGPGGANYELGMAFTGPDGSFQGSTPPPDVPAPPPPPGWWTLPEVPAVAVYTVKATELKSGNSITYPIMIIPTEE